MQEYVLVHVRKSGYQIGQDSDPEILLVLKDKPKWQVGRLNLVGGKIEPGERPEDAAARELMEEAGIRGMTTPFVFGKLYGVDSLIHCCLVDIGVRCSTIMPREEETEKVAWYRWTDAKHNPRLVPNLKVVIPLLQMGVGGWEIKDQNSSVLRHEIMLELDIPIPFTNGGPDAATYT